MKKIPILLMLLVLIFSVFYIVKAYNIKTNVNNINYKTMVQNNINDIKIYTNMYPEMTKPDASMTNGKKVENLFIYDFSTAKYGYIIIQPLVKDIACIITTEDKTYKYLHLPLKKNILPLGLNDANYEVSVFKPYDVENNKYLYVINNEEINKNFEDCKDIFLMPNYVVNFSNKSTYKDLAIKLSSYTDYNTIINIKNWVYKNIKYDKKKANEIETKQLGFNHYIPNLETIYEEKTGVCLDKAAFATALLRLNNIPAKLAIGNWKDEYHAWVIVKLYDKPIIMDPTSNFIGTSDDYTIDIIF